MSPEAEAILGQAMRLTAAAEMAARARVERAEGPPSPRRPSPPIVVGGMLYPSIAAAVSALGLTAQKVRRALDLGKLDQLAPGLRAKPVEIKGRIFASRTIAARVAGVAPSTVSGMAARGRADRVGIGTGTLQRKPVEIGGVVYPSMAEAARHLGLAYGTIKSAARRGRLGSVGTGLRPSPRKAHQQGERA